MASPITEDQDDWYTPPTICEDDALLLTVLQLPFEERLTVDGRLGFDPLFLFGLEKVRLQGGWVVTLFFDAGDFDYIEEIEAPDGRKWTLDPNGDQEAAHLPFGHSVFNANVSSFDKWLKEQPRRKR